MSFEKMIVSMKNYLVDFQAFKKKCKKMFAFLKTISLLCGRGILSMSNLIFTSMKTIKFIIGFMWCFATMMICGVDTEYTPLSHVLGLVAVWIILGLVISKIDWKNE